MLPWTWREAAVPCYPPRPARFVWSAFQPVPIRSLVQPADDPGMHRLSPSDVAAMRHAAADGGASAGELADEWSVSVSTVHGVLTGDLHPDEAGPKRTKRGRTPSSATHEAVTQELLRRVALRCTVTDTGCWLWPTTARSGSGCRVQVGGRSVRLVRAVYTALIHGLPPNVALTHACRFWRDGCAGEQCRCGPCIRPDHHLRTRGGSPVGRQSLRTPGVMCPRGHAYTPFNSRYRVTAEGCWARVCRICSR